MLDAQWERQVCRKLSLRDLQIILAVAEQGSMAKAAARLEITQSAVSQFVAETETELGVRLFERSRRGAELTDFGRLLIARARVAFDELRSGLLEIDHLKNAGSGEIRIGCPETLAASVLPMAIDSFSRQWPSVSLTVDTFYGGATADKLRDRSVDLAFMRGGPALDAMMKTDEFDIVPLFEDSLSIVVDANSVWARRPGAQLRDLHDAPWIVLPYGWGEEAVPNEFRRHNLPPPRIGIRTFSVHLRLHLVATGRFVTALPASIVRLYAPFFDFKVLPITIPNNPYSVAVISYHGRTLTRSAELFIRSAVELFKTWPAHSGDLAGTSEQGKQGLREGGGSLDR